MIKRLFKRDLLVVDIVYLTEEYKDLPLDELRLKLEQELNRDVLLTDTSRANVTNTQNMRPCYILK